MHISPCIGLRPEECRKRKSKNVNEQKKKYRGVFTRLRGILRIKAAKEIDTSRKFDQARVA